MDAVVSFRDDGDLIDMNPAGRALFGIDGLVDGGNLPRDFLHEPERFAVLRAELAVRGRLKDFEMRLRTPGGEPRAVLFTGGAEEPSADGRRVINGIFRDVTIERELQRQLLQAQKMESVGTLAGGIAHDFNNILTAIIGYIHIIRGEIDDRESVLSHIAIIDTSARRAVELTKRLLSFARGGVTDRRPLQLNDIVAEAVQLLQRTMDRSIEITTDCAPDLPRILGDQGQIHQVLINLCVNARDAMPSGGAMTVRTRTGALMTDGQEHLSGNTPRGIVVLEVSDTGSGIAQANLSKIFDPFFTTKGPAQGTGLGLSIVYGVVKQHGGQVSVTSVQGKGTTFVLSFPASSESTAEVAAAPRPAAAVRGRETILVVDDETDVRTLVQISLARLGYTVLEAGDGIEALDVYKRHEKAIDLALIDLIMPRMGGRETYHPVEGGESRTAGPFRHGIRDGQEHAGSPGHGRPGHHPEAVRDRQPRERDQEGPGPRTRITAVVARERKDHHAEDHAHPPGNSRCARSRRARIARPHRGRELPVFHRIEHRRQRGCTST